MRDTNATANRRARWLKIDAPYGAFALLPTTAPTTASTPARCAILRCLHTLINTAAVLSLLYAVASYRIPGPLSRGMMQFPQYPSSCVYSPFSPIIGLRRRPPLKLVRRS
ncbi:hypothetical protein AOQ84DRAFT_190053 [Glonium stellatum]|uniref:Uncharacterized protein n=1 Tax=Glonium stellatum TaxID=574774 RepID=A0A8E2EP24_9PEZI|nr:hypothetical protein AOQ84DRAFT_190053 [Glonium stellatum]